MKAKTTLMMGTSLGFLAVALGAFGAHALKATLTAAGRVDTYELAVRYHFFHALALVLVGICQVQADSKWLHRAGTFLTIGVLLFSGSLYLLALTSRTAVAFVTPFGGVFMLLGWASFCYHFYQQKAL